MDAIFEWANASEKAKELAGLLGHKIVNIIKVSYETFQQHLDYLDEVKIEGYRDEDSFFKYSYGGVLIAFDNESEYSFGSAEDLNSVVLCCQKKSTGEYNENYILNSKDVASKISIHELEQEHDYKEITNQEIVSINILTVSNLNYKEQGIPSEQGVEFILKNDKKIIISHNLTNNSFVFSVLTELDQISPDTIVKLKIV